MKTIYTAPAQHELAAFQARQQDMLERLVAERKSVLGDEVLEITASDIKIASEKIQIDSPSSDRILSTELVVRAYILIGIVMMVGAFFYPQLIALYASNRTQALIFVVGGIMVCVGWMLSLWIQSRRLRMVAKLHSDSASSGRTSNATKASSASGNAV